MFRPKKELKGFRKIFLKKGEKKRIRIAFDDKSFRFWNVKTGQWETEGGEYQIMIYGKNAEEALTDAQSMVAELGKLWSVTDENSDIYVIKHSQGRPVNVSEETKEIPSFALDMAKQMGGALEPTIYPVLTAWGFTTGENQILDKSELKEILRDVNYENVHVSGNEVTLPDGMELDLGAVGKGFAADEVSDVLKQAGVNSALLDLGGNIQLIGTKPDGADWKIGLRDPLGGKLYRRFVHKRPFKSINPFDCTMGLPGQ